MYLFYSQRWLYFVKYALTYLHAGLQLWKLALGAPTARGKIARWQIYTTVSKSIGLVWVFVCVCVRMCWEYRTILCVCVCTLVLRIQNNAVCAHECREYRTVPGVHKLQWAPGSVQTMLLKVWQTDSIVQILSHKSTILQAYNYYTFKEVSGLHTLIGYLWISSITRCCIKLTDLDLQQCKINNKLFKRWISRTEHTIVAHVPCCYYGWLFNKA